MTVIGQLKALLLLDDSQFQQTISSAQQTMQNVGASLSGAGRSLSVGLTAPLVAAGAAAIKLGTDFNSGLANVASLGAEAAASIENWKPALQGMALATGKSTDDMTGGLYQVVSAFGVADDTLQVLDSNARAAAAGMATTEEAINLTSAVTKAYGDTSAQAVRHAADLALKTVQLGQTTFPDLAASIGRVTPLTAALGVSQEELFAIMATGTGVTGSAAEVGTQLRGILQALMVPTGDMAQLLADMGYESGAAAIEAQGIGGILGDVLDTISETGQPLQDFISSIEGQTLALALGGGQADVFRDKLGAMADAAGAVDSAFAAQTEGVNAVGFELQQARVQMQIWAQNIADELMPALAGALQAIQPMVGYVTDLIGRFTALDPQQKQIVLGALAFAAALGPLLMIIGSISTGIGALIGVVGALSAPVIIAVAAIVGAVALLRKAWEVDFAGIRDFVAGVWEGIQVAFSAFKSLFAGDFAAFSSGIREAWELAWGAAVAFLGNIWEMVQPRLLAFWENVKTWWLGIDWRQLGFDAVTALLTALGNMYQYVAPKLAALWDQLKTWFVTTDWQALAGSLIDGLVQGLANLGPRFVDAVVQLAQGAWDAIRGFFGIASDSRLMIQAGKYIVGGLATGVSATDRLDAAVNRLTNSAVPPVGMLAGIGAGGPSIHIDRLEITGITAPEQVADAFLSLTGDVLQSAYRRGF